MSLQSDLDRASKRIKIDTDKKYRAVCLGLFGKVVKRTPVGNPDLWQGSPPPGYIGGTLRNAWRASIGVASQEVGSNPDAGAAAAYSSVNSVASFINAGDDFVAANNMPYARPIEEGTSQQAPQGMVAITLNESGFDAERLMRG